MNALLTIVWFIVQAVVLYGAALIIGYFYGCEKYAYQWLAVVLFNLWVWLPYILFGTWPRLSPLVDSQFIAVEVVLLLALWLGVFYLGYRTGARRLKAEWDAHHNVRDSTPYVPDMTWDVPLSGQIHRLGQDARVVHEGYILTPALPAGEENTTTERLPKPKRVKT